MKPNDPLSVLTAAAYPLAGVSMAELSLWRPESLVMLAALTLLGAGTAAHHWTGLSDRRGQDLDHAGMVATYAALATAAVGPWYWMLGAAAVGAVLVEYAYDLPNRALLGACVWIAIVAGFVSGVWWITGFGVLFMATGAALQPGGDLEHSAWHVLTAIGTALLYLSFP